MAHLHQMILRSTHSSRILTLEIQFLKGGFQFFIIFLKIDIIVLLFLKIKPELPFCFELYLASFI